VVWQESRWRTGAVSPVGARGLAQLMPGTARDLGVNPHNPSANLEGGARYLRMQLDAFGGDVEKALAAYNAGPGRPKSWREKLSRPVEGAIFAETIPFNETRGYVKHVLANANYYAALATAKPQSIKAKLGTISPKAVVLTELP